MMKPQEVHERLDALQLSEAEATEMLGVGLRTLRSLEEGVLNP